MTVLCRAGRFFPGERRGPCGSSGTSSNRLTVSRMAPRRSAGKNIGWVRNFSKPRKQFRWAVWPPRRIQPRIGSPRMKRNDRRHVWRRDFPPGKFLPLKSSYLISVVGFASSHRTDGINFDARFSRLIERWNRLNLPVGDHGVRSGGMGGTEICAGASLDWLRAGASGSRAGRGRGCCSPRYYGRWCRPPTCRARSCLHGVPHDPRVRNRSGARLSERSAAAWPRLRAIAKRDDQRVGSTRSTSDCVTISALGQRAPPRMAGRSARWVNALHLGWRDDQRVGSTRSTSDGGTISALGQRAPPRIA